jgi:hypothetical protein
MRVLVGEVDEEFDDVAALAEPQRSQVLATSSYAASQSYAAACRAEGSMGLVYPSVRRPGGGCLAAFKPKAVRIPRQERHLQYRWNGERVDRYFDYSVDRWVSV